MKKTHQQMLFFLFLFFLSAVTACTKKTETLVFYQTNETELQETFNIQDANAAGMILPEASTMTNTVETSLSSATASSTPEMITVYLCGQVCNPGVYILEAGSRLYQAVEMAGGLTNQAQAEAVNLARVISDSEQIYIPDVSETVVLPEIASTQAEDSDNGAKPANGSDELIFSSDAGNYVNINQASVEELMQLPGIGQVKAEAIVAYRNSNGLFTSIEEIKNVPGIKEAAFEKIKSMIII